MLNIVVCRVKSYAEDLVPIIEDKGESHEKYQKIGKGVPSHTIQKKLHYNVYEESLFKKQVFENNYNTVLSVKDEVNIYSLKK